LILQAIYFELYFSIYNNFVCVKLVLTNYTIFDYKIPYVRNDKMFNIYSLDSYNSIKFIHIKHYFIY